jgi:hypothetical protein
MTNMEEKISHERNQVYIGNTNLVCGTNLDYKIEGTKIGVRGTNHNQRGNKNSGREQKFRP